MQPKELVRELLPLLGGKSNIAKITHCTTRLRLVLHEEGKADMAAIERLDGVEGVYTRIGQFQIIFGVDVVNKVYRNLAEIMETAEAPARECAKPAAAVPRSVNPAARLVILLSNIFVPIIPVLVASGLLNGLLGMMKAFQWVTGNNAFIKMLSIFSSSAFIFLPILVGFHAAKEFGSNPHMGAVIGGILTHPALLNPFALSSKTPDTLDLFGIQIDLIGYQGTVIPVILSVYLMSRFEQQLYKAVPRSLQMLVVPFLAVILTGMVSLLVIGPATTYIGGFIISGLDVVLKHASVILGLLFGGLYSLIVVTGLHHSFHAVEASLLANPKVGVNFLLPIWSMANIAQGGAGLAVFFKPPNQPMKEISLPAALSALLGIAEPVIFGINLKLGKPFIGAAIGGALGGAYVGFSHVAANSLGLTGIPMIAITAPLGMSNLVHYLTGFAVALLTAFISTWLLLPRAYSYRL